MAAWGVRVLMVVIMAVGCLGAPGRVMAQTYRNDVIPANCSDPMVMRWGNDFFLTATWGGEGFIGLHHSSDLVHWHKLGCIFPQAPVWVNPQRHELWNGEIEYHPGEKLFYFFYSALPRDHKDGTNGHAIAVATAPWILGPWTDHGIIYRGGGFDGIELGNGAVIELNLFMDNGTPYFVCQEELHGRGLVMGQLTADWRSIKPETLRRIYTPAPPRQSWEDNICEGHEIFKRDNHYWIFYSGGGFAYGGNYAVGLLEADHIEGPWRPWPGNPILHSNQWVNSPGGMSSPLRMQDDTWWVIYHGYLNRRGQSWERTAFLDQMFWDEQGRPFFKEAPSQHIKPAPATPQRRNLLMDGDFGFEHGHELVWDLSAGASIHREAGSDRGVLSLPTDGDSAISARASQRVVRVAGGDYRLSVQASLEGAVELAVRVSREGEGVLAEKVCDAHSSACLTLAFGFMQRGYTDLLIELESRGGGGLVCVEQVNLRPVFTRQLEVENAGAVSWHVPMTYDPKASNEHYYQPFEHVGQQLEVGSILVPRRGWYDVAVECAATGTLSLASMNVYANGQFAGPLEVRPTRNLTEFTVARIPVLLEAGENLMTYKYEVGSQGKLSFDRIVLTSLTGPPDGWTVPPRPGACESFARQYYEPAASNPWKLLALRGDEYLELTRSPLGQWYLPNDEWCRGYLPWICPGRDHDFVVRWQARRPGAVRVDMMFGKQASEEGDGTRLQLRLNGRAVWPSQGWHGVTRRQPRYAQSPMLQVQAGDRLEMVVQCGQDNAYDIMVYDQCVTYVEAPGADKEIGASSNETMSEK